MSRERAAAAAMPMNSCPRTVRCNTYNIIAARARACGVVRDPGAASRNLHGRGAFTSPVPPGRASAVRFARSAPGAPARSQ